MKQFLRTLVLSIVLLGCEEDASLTFVAQEFPANGCETCPKVEVIIPEAFGKDSVALAINDELKAFAIATLNPLEEQEQASIEDAIQEFNQEYAKLKEDYEEAVPWELTLDGTVSYQSETLVSIRMDSYSFTGGAHGYGATSFLNFNPQTGDLMESQDFISDYNGFTRFCEARFRSQENIPGGENINSTGYFFEGDRFHLPESIGFTATGMILVYNAYEIASYADGQKILEFTFKEVQPFLKNNMN